MTLNNRILIADDHPVFRDGLCRLVASAFPETELFEAGSVEELEAVLAQHGAPAMFVLDLVFPGMNPPETLPTLRRRFPTASLVVVSMLDDDATIKRVTSLGIDGYIAKSIAGEAMIAALRDISVGQFVIARPAPGEEGQSSTEITTLFHLTQRQREILTLIGEGHSNKAIGRELDLSPFTVRNHVSMLFRIFGSTTRSDLAEMARNRRV